MPKRGVVLILQLVKEDNSEINSLFGKVSNKVAKKVKQSNLSKMNFRILL